MILALKLVLTPLLIASVSLAGRRWGPGVSGLMIGLPLTSGPVSFILTRQYGAAFAAQAAVGTILGQASVCVFALTYSRVATRAGWPASAAAGIGAFFLATVAWNRLAPPLILAFAILLGTIATVLLLMPRRAASLEVVTLAAWDLPARMAVATLFVVTLTAAAGALGPQLSGLLSPFPVFGVVLAAFTQRSQGPRAAASLLRGIVLGSWAFGAFFLVVGALLTSMGAGWTYALATAGALAADGLSYYVSR